SDRHACIETDWNIVTIRHEQLLAGLSPIDVPR
ncbi:unnamed protein product, partial [Allacma fusca]